MSGGRRGIERIRTRSGRPLLRLLAAGSLLALGGLCLLPPTVSLLPGRSRPRLEIAADLPGAGRDEVLERLTRPLEQRLGALPGVTTVASRTADGGTRLRVDGDGQTDPDRWLQEAEHRLADLRVPGVDLRLELVTGDPQPLIEVAVFGAMGAVRTAFARDALAPELARLPGAGRLEIVGLAPLHPVVRPRSAALAARGLTVADVVSRLLPLGTAVAAGRARSGALARTLLVREDAPSLAALRALQVTGSGGRGGASLLGDVAEVGLEEVRDETFYRLDGREGCLVRLFPAPDAAGGAQAALAALARERIAELRRWAPGGLEVRLVADRGAEEHDGRKAVVRYRLDPDLTPEAARRQGAEVEALALSALGVHPLHWHTLQRRRGIGIAGEGIAGAGIAGAGIAGEAAGNEGFIDGEWGDESWETGRVELSFADPASAGRALAPLRRALARRPEVEARVDAPARGGVFASLTGGAHRLEVAALAPTPERARALARRTVERLAPAGWRLVEDRAGRPRSALVLTWDLARLTSPGSAGAAGTDGRDALEAEVRAALGERTAGRARIEGAEPEILIRPADPADAALLPVAVDGRILPLAAVARLALVARPPALERENGRPAVRLTFTATASGGGSAEDPERILAAVPHAVDEEVARR